MTTDDKSGMSDAEFEAFLKGEDELSRGLKALPQPSPSAEQDAAILKRVKFALAQEGRPAAANDPAPMGFNRRWRVPAGIAAALIAGVLTHQSWQAGSDVERAGIAYSPPPVADAVPPPAPEQLPEAKANAPQALAERAGAAPAPKAAPSGARQPRMEIAPPSPAPAPAPAPEARAPAPAPVAPAPTQSAPPALQYAPAAEAQRAARPQIASEPPRPAALPRADGSVGITVTGSRNRAEARKSSAADKTTPQAWLELIDEMLKAGLPRDALDEWSKFRQAYPDYPVPEPLADRIKAIQK